MSKALPSPMQGTVVEILVGVGDQVLAGQELLIIDCMKLQHAVSAPADAVIETIIAKPTELIDAGQTLLRYRPAEASKTSTSTKTNTPTTNIRPDLQRVLDLHAHGQDQNRPEAMAKLQARGKQSARQNIAQLTDDSSFVEYGALAVAAQRGRRELQELRQRTPADGLICGVGQVNAQQFGDAARTAIMAYDYTVLAGTQGIFNHGKTDRMLEVIDKSPMPLVFFTEGGGGRPGDVDVQHINSTGLNCTSFGNLAALNGKAPMIGVNAGYCFAGNAAFLAMHDIIIGTKDSWLGMGGPAMIEGGGLGVVDKNDIGPAAVQVANGTIDLLAATEHEAVKLAKRCLGYFQGDWPNSTAADQQQLRQLVPEDRNRAFDIRKIITTLADAGSVLELKPQHAPGYITTLARIDGKTVAVLANNNQHLSGAIDAAGARKADRFLKLCEQFRLPVLYLVDCPGLMVGPEYDAQGTARAAGDLYITAARLTVPTGAIIIRKAYGLGAMAAMGGSSRAATFCISWPTGECGPMGIEGAIRLGFKKELAAVTDPGARQQQFEAMVNQAWEHTQAVNGASTVELDAVIDPAESRTWIKMLLL